MLKFKEYIRLIEQNTVGYHNDGPGSGFYGHGGAYRSSDQTGSEQPNNYTGHSGHLPSIDLELLALPTVTRTSIIRVVERNRNPVRIQLDDGTRLFMQEDDVRRLERKGHMVEVGKTAKVVFQRRGDGQSMVGPIGKDSPSQVQSIEIY